MLCRALESQDFAGAVEAYTAALAVDPQHRQVNKQLQLGLCKVQQQMGKAEEAVLVGVNRFGLGAGAGAGGGGGSVQCQGGAGWGWAGQTRA